MKNILSNILKIISILVFIVILALLGTSFILGYNGVIDNVMALINYPIDNRDTLMEVLSPPKLLFVQCCLIFVVVMLATAIYFFNDVYKMARCACSRLWQSISNILMDVCSLEGGVALTLPVLATLYFAMTIPVSYDEAFTYITFTNKPFFYCLIFYPYPNNHVLHSLLTNVTEHLPFFSVLFNLRMVAILSSICTWAVAYSFVKRYFNNRLALLVVGISSVLYMSMFYNFMARGYGLMYFFFIIALYATCNIITKDNRRKDWIYFSISSILGFYAVPSFLYPFITLNVLILIYNYKHIKYQFIYNTIVMAGVVLTYMPIVLVDGIKTLIGNKFVVPIDRMDVMHQLPEFLSETLEQIFALPSYIVLVFMALSCILLFYNKGDNYKKIATAWFIFVIAPFALLILHSVIPFSRTFLYYGFVLVLLTAIPLKRYINKIPNAILFISVFAIQIISVVNFNNKIGERESFNTTGKEINDYVLKEDNKTYFMGTHNGSTNFEFEYIIRGYDVNNIVKGDAVDVSADSLLNYDYVILDANNDHTIERKPAFSNSFKNVYKR